MCFMSKYYLADYASNMTDLDIRYVGGLFPKGRLTIVVADGSVGKTELLIQTSLAITDNRPLGNAPFNKVYLANDEQVMLIETENRKYDLINRLLKLNANLNHYYFPKDINDTVNFKNPSDLITINTLLSDKKTGLIIVDSLLGLNLGIDENKQDASDALTSLALLAERHQVAVVCTQYINKTQIANKITATNIRGHSSIPQLAQLIWAIDKEDSFVRRLYQVKNNLENTDATIYKYHIKDNRIEFIDSKGSVDNNISKLIKEARNRIYAANITKSDKEIALLIHQLEPNQQLNNLVNWVKRKRNR